MLSVTSTEKDGPTTTLTFDKTEVLIGRVKGNDVVLPKTNVSKRHSRIVVKDGKIILIDLKSTNGTFVNGEKITGPHVMQEGDKIFIGDFTLEVRETGGGSVMPSSPSPMAGPGMQPNMPSFNAGPSAASLPSIGGMDPHHMNPGMNGPMGPRNNSFGRPSVPGMPTSGGVPGVPEQGLSSPMDAGAPVSAPLGGPTANNLNAPNLGVPMGPGVASGMGAPQVPNLGSPTGANFGGNMSGMGPGLGGSMGPGAAPSLGVPMGPGSAANMGSALGAPSGGNLGVSTPKGGAHPGSPLSPSLELSPSVGLGAASSPVSAPSLSAGAGLGSQPLSGARSMPSLGGVKQPSTLGASVADGGQDKGLRVSSANLSGNNAKNAGVARSASSRNIGTAALPEEIVVDDARTPESEAWMRAARVVMDKYLSMNDYQAIASMPYPPEPETQDSCYAQLVDCVRECQVQIGAVNTDALIDFLLKEACGLGAVDSLIDDAEVSAFNVYNFETIVVERKGHREISSLQFTSADTLYLVAQRLLAFNGVTPQNAPAVTEVRFGDGTQIEVILPPVSVASTSLVVRKPSHEFRALSVLAQHEMLSHEMEQFLNLCVKARRNILIVGAQTSGRTTLLNALGAEIPDGERIVTVENSAVLVMPQLYVMNLEAQSSSFGQNGDLASLIRQAGRLRAERVLADSIQSPADAIAFVSALCSGAQGSMATCTGLNASEGFELFKRMIGTDPAVNGLVGNIDIVVNVRSFTDAKRRIVEIAEVSETSNGTYELIPLFVWTGSGMGNMAVGDGHFKALGNVPAFYRELERGGMALDPSIFNP